MTEPRSSKRTVNPGLSGAAAGGRRSSLSPPWRLRPPEASSRGLPRCSLVLPLNAHLRPCFVPPAPHPVTLGPWRAQHRPHSSHGGGVFLGAQPMLVGGVSGRRGAPAGAEVGWRLAGLPAFERQESGGRGSAAGLALRAARLRTGGPSPGPRGRGTWQGAAARTLLQGSDVSFRFQRRHVPSDCARFSFAAMTSRRKLRALKQHTFILSPFWRPRVRLGAPRLKSRRGRPAPPGGSAPIPGSGGAHTPLLTASFSGSKPAAWHPGPCVPRPLARTIRLVQDTFPIVGSPDLQP